MQFTDRRQRTWSIDVTVGSIRRVLHGCQVDLTAALEGKLMAELGQDPLRFASVLFWLLEPQAKAAGVLEEDLAEALAGEVLHAAYEAFCEALISFFHRPEQREVLGKLKTKADQVLTQAGRQALSLVESDTLNQKIDREIAKARAAAESILGS